MAFMRQSTPSFTIRQGDPWTINDQPTDATTPREALGEVFDQATTFPVEIAVHTDSSQFHLILDSQGRTQAVKQPAPAVEPQTVALPQQRSTYQHLGSRPKGLKPQPDPDLDEDPLTLEEELMESRMRQRRSSSERPAGRRRGWIFLSALALVVAGVGGWLLNDAVRNDPFPWMTQSSSNDQAAGQGSPWNLEEGQSPVAVLGSTVVTRQEKQIRFFNALNGEQIGETITTENPESIRPMEGANSSAVDLADGNVALIRNGEIQVVKGQLNGRGTSPLVIDGSSYITDDGKTHTLEEGTVAVNATPGGAALAGSGADVTIDGHKRTLEAPEAGASISQWIRATADEAVVIWTKGESSWIAVHDPLTGKAGMHEMVKADDVQLRQGIIWLSSTRYLVGQSIKSLCTGGEQIGSMILCPSGSTWQSEDAKISLTQKPQALNRRFSIINNHVTATANGAVS